MFANYIREADPVLNEDNWELIEVGGGSEARAAMERGDLDGYFGRTSRTTPLVTTPTTHNSSSSIPEVRSTRGSLTRNLKRLRRSTTRLKRRFERNPQGLILNNNGGFAEDDATTAIELVNDSHMLLLPPGTPDEIIGIHEDAFGAAAESDELAEAVANSFAPEDHNPAVGDEVRDVVQSKYESMYEDEAVRTMIQDQLFC